MKKLLITALVLGIVVATPVARAQVSSTFENAVLGLAEATNQLAQQMVQLVQALDSTYSKQIASLNSQVSDLSARLAVLEAKPQNLGATSASTQQDDAAVTALMQSYNAKDVCMRSLSGKPTDQDWANMRQYDRIFQLMCKRVGI